MRTLSRCGHQPPRNRQPFLRRLFPSFDPFSLPFRPVQMRIEQCVCHRKCSSWAINSSLELCRQQSIKSPSGRDQMRTETSVGCCRRNLSAVPLSQVDADPRPRIPPHAVLASTTVHHSLPSTSGGIRGFAKSWAAWISSGFRRVVGRTGVTSLLLWVCGWRVTRLGAWRQLFSCDTADLQPMPPDCWLAGPKVSAWTRWGGIRRPWPDSGFQQCHWSPWFPVLLNGASRPPSSSSIAKPHRPTRPSIPNSSSAITASGRAARSVNSRPRICGRLSSPNPPPPLSPAGSPWRRCRPGPWQRFDAMMRRSNPSMGLQLSGRQ